MRERKASRVEGPCLDACLDPSNRCVKRRLEDPVAWEASRVRVDPLTHRLDVARARKQMSLPPLDPDDPQFVLFVRSKRLPQWFPFSVVSGGSQAKLLTKAMENDFGKKLYGNTLTKNIAGVVYKDMDNIKKAVFNQYPRLKEAKELEFGYKIRKEESLQGTFGGSGVEPIPPQEELKGVVDKVKDFFAGNS